MSAKAIQFILIRLCAAVEIGFRKEEVMMEESNKVSQVVR